MLLRLDYNSREMHEGHSLWKQRQGIKEETISTLEKFL